MIEIFAVDTDDLWDMLLLLKYFLKRINSKNEFLINENSLGFKCLSTKGLTRYEKHSRFYRFVYEEKVVLMDSRIAKERIKSIDMCDFFVVNPIDVVNVGRIRYFDSKKIYLSDNDRGISVSRRNRALLEKYLDIVYNQKLVDNIEFLE